MHFNVHLFLFCTGNNEQTINQPADKAIQEITQGNSNIPILLGNRMPRNLPFWASNFEIRCVTVWFVARLIRDDKRSIKMKELSISLIPCTEFPAHICKRQFCASIVFLVKVMHGHLSLWSTNIRPWRTICLEDIYQSE